MNHQISSDFFLEKNLWNYFSRRLSPKKWKKKTSTAISNLQIPFSKGCDPKEMEEKKHSNLKPPDPLFQGL